MYDLLEQVLQLHQSLSWYPPNCELICIFFRNTDTEDIYFIVAVDQNQV